MVKDFRYKFQKGSKKSRCPECGKKTFVQYMDANTGELLPDKYGRCDRESKCAYHHNPYKDGYSKMIYEKELGLYPGKRETILRKISEKYVNPMPKAAPINQPVFIPVDVFNQTRRGYEQNTFIQNLLSRVPFPFCIQDIEKVISQYHLGTVCNGYRAGAITFPFIDKAGNVRAIQVKQFDQANHTTGTDFLHSIIEKYHTQRDEPLPGWLEGYKVNEKAVSCLFGEHLLSQYPLSPVALVEAPKTAVYCSLYFGFPGQPENLLWLAVYNRSSLNLDKCRALQGKDVYLFPDLSKDGNTFELWNNKAKELTDLLPGTRFIVSDLLEAIAPDELREQGADIADVLINLDWRNFRQMQSTTEPHPEPLPTLESEKGENSEAPEKPFFSQSKPSPVQSNCLSMEQLKEMAFQHFNKYPMIKDKAGARAKYFTCWANDMDDLIRAAGGTQQQFLNSLNIY